MMHGRIEVVSRVGEGSVFTVHVPLRTDGTPRPNHDGELAGLTCTLHGGTTLMEQDVATCLQASSAIVDIAGDTEPAASRTGVDIWIGDEDAARRQAASEPGRNVLLISRGRRRSARRLSPNLVQIDGNLLTRGILAEAVRIAAHLDEEIAPQQPTPATTPTLTREQALHEGRLILVAEDNETNQQVIRLQLEKLGWAADVVANGAEAVRRWEDGGYRLILSDLHMPTMDGFELAQAIRAREAAAGRARIPIIALTAAALPGELEHAIDAGMDDHLTKPVSLDGLRAALDKWSQSAAKTRIDPTTLPALIGDDADVLAALRRQYADELRAAIARIAEALDRHDAAAVIVQAHKLKSSSRTIGAHDLGARFEALEIEGERAPAGVLEARFEALRPEAEAVLDELGAAAA
jgi:CheY-like chemotaxis protein